MLSLLFSLCQAGVASVDLSTPTTLEAPLIIEQPYTVSTTIHIC